MAAARAPLTPPSTARESGATRRCGRREAACCATEELYEDFYPGDLLTERAIDMVTRILDAGLRRAAVEVSKREGRATHESDAGHLARRV